MITIRRAEYKDIPAIMRYLNEHWKPGNILATNREFFEWQFVDDDGIVNVFIGIDEETGKIYGTLGLILYNHTDHPDVGGCTWQTIKSENPVLGLDISKYAHKTINTRYEVSPALTKRSIRIMELGGAEMIKLSHYYRLNGDVEYRLAEVIDKTIPEVRDSGYKFVDVNSIEGFKKTISDDELRKTVPYKDYSYIKKRYFDHPVYDYSLLKIVRPDGDSKAVIVVREVEYDGARACKIVNYYGEINEFKHIGFAIDNYIKENGYEYIDIYSRGVDTDVYENAGFVIRDENSANIIPNYYHPFEKKNVELTMRKDDIEGIRAFRSDGDQDRPG